MDFSETVDQAMKNVSQIVDPPTAQAIRNFLMEYGEDCVTLWELSQPTEEDCRKMIEEVTGEASKKLSKEQLSMLREILEDLYLKGKSLAEALNLNEQNLEDIYRMAYAAYNSGQYLEAKNLFVFLTLMDRENPRFFFGAGASYHMLKDYSNAIAFYTCVTWIDLLNPLPWYHLGDCYIHQNLKNEAAQAFNNVITRTKSNPAYEKIRSRSQMLRDKILADAK